VTTPISPTPHGVAAAAPNIGREMAKGAAWMVLMRLTIRGIGLVSTIVLARLLVPDDFGLIALSTSIVFAVETLGQFSFDVALIRDSKASREQYDTAWTLTVIRGWLTAIIVAACAVPIGEFCREPRLPMVLYGLAVATVIEGYQNIGIVDLRKDLRFRREFNFMVIQKVISFVVTTALAVILREYWALLVGLLVGRISGTVLSYSMSPFRPRHCLKEWRPLFHYSKWLLMNNILMLLGRGDVYIIGPYFGAHDLGVYNVSVEISSLPSTELVAPIQRAIYPGFAKLAGEIDRLKQSYIDGLGLLSMLAVPASIGIAVLADPIVRVLLGSRWLAAIPLLQILSLNGLIRLAGGNAGSVLMAIGRPKIITILTLLNLAILWPSLVIGITVGGLPGAAWALVATAALNVVLSYAIVLRTLQMSIFHLGAAMWRSWAAAAVMATAVYWACALVSAWLDYPVVLLTVGVCVGVISYIAAILLFWSASGRPRSAERMTLDALAQLRARLPGGKPRAVRA
jgi:lipopolysaccharide exporter